MKHHLLRLPLMVTLLLPCAWPRTSVAQPTNAYAVVAWGNNSEGQTTVPVAAQNGVTAIAAGNVHAVALKDDGSVVAWGGNHYGQVTGTPTTVDPYSAIASPVTLGGQVLTGVTAIAAGWAHTVALRNDGLVVAWGNNQYGQTTVPVAAQSGVTAVAAGDGHTVASKNDGSVVAWGNNQYGQTTVPVAAQSGVTAVAAGYHHTVALKNDGSVVAWGNNQYGQTTVPAAAQSGVSAIAAGGYHTVALKNDGSVVAWGGNQWGQRTVPLAAQSGVTAVAAGELHTVALKNDGSVLAWGNNQSGQTTVPVAAQSGVTAIAARSHNSFALVIPTAPSITTQPVGQAVNAWQSAGFTVVATGYPLNYQWRKDGVDLAGATNPTYHLPYAHTNDAGNYTVVVSNSVGSVTSAPPAVLTVNALPGMVVAWGWNRPTVPVVAQSGIVAIAASEAHSVALKEDGSVVVWGWPGFGQTTVPAAARSRVTAIAAGGACDFGCNGHTVALKDDGTVVAWGRNGAGQVTGTPGTNELASPVTLGGQVLSGVTAIAAGWEHSVALKDDGTVVAWGANDSGQVTGTPATVSPYYAIATPVTLGGQVLSGVTAIAAGPFHTVALKSDGTVVAWGTGWAVDVPAGVSGVTAIAAGYGHTVALKNDGSVVAWGNNGYGEVTGTPTTEAPYSAIASPVTLGGQVLSGVTAIAAGYWIGDTGGHTVALKNDGTVVAWGLNSDGQATVPPGLSGVTAIAAGGLRSLALIGGVPLLPSLNARPNGNELILSWPTNAVGFTLQSTPDLTPPVTWLDSTNVPAVIGAHFTLTNTPSGGGRLYRLRKM